MMDFEGGDKMDAVYTGEKISQLRKQKGLTQQDLADLLHVTNKAVSKWERGKNFPDLSMLLPLAETLDTTVSQLLGVEEPIPETTIAVLSAISLQEKKAIQHSLYLFILMALIASVLYLVLYFNSVLQYERLLLVLHMFILINGGMVLEYLHKKFSSGNGFHWPSGRDELFADKIKISLALWRERLHRR